MLRRRPISQFKISDTLCMHMAFQMAFINGCVAPHLSVMILCDQPRWVVSRFYA